MGLLDLKLKKEIELLNAKIGTLESNQVSLISWLKKSEAENMELSQKTCAVFFHDDLIDQNMKLRNLLRQAQPSEQEAPSLFHQIKDVLKDKDTLSSSEYAPCHTCGSSQFTTDRVAELEKELSERLSSEEMVDIQSENYSSWLKEKEGRLLAEAKVQAQAKVIEGMREAFGKITIETSDDVAFDIASKALDSSTDAGKVK